MKKIKRERSWLLALFGTPFFGVGVGFLLLSVIPTIYEGIQMESWPSTEGILTSARLTSSTSDGSTSYGVEAHYQYRVDSRSYNNDRVAISSGTDNIGNFQYQLGRQLEHNYNNNTPVTVYYNPDDPTAAVLNRTLRWGLVGFKMIFVLVFGGIGFGLIVFGLRGKKVIDSPEAEQKPWLKRVEWADNQILSGARTGLYFIWAFAIFWNLFSAPAIFGFIKVREEEGAVAFVILLFPVIGLLLLYWAIRKGMEWKRFGYTPLQMDPFPGAIGGDVGGEVYLRIPFNPKMVCEVSVSSLYSYVSGSGKNRSRHERVEWQDSGYARVEHAANGIKLVFRMEVPEGQHKSEEKTGDSYHLWRVNVKADIPGVDFDRDFEIPVYKTGERSRMIKVDSSHEVPQGAPQLRAEALLPISRNGMTMELYYPMLRHFVPSLLGVVFGIVFAGAGVFLWDQAIFMGVVFGAVGTIVVLGALYSALNTLRIELDGRTITITRTLLGVPISTKQAGYHDVTTIEIKTGMTTQQGNKHKINYKIIANTRNGELLLAEKLDSHSKAKLAAAFFREKVGLKQEERNEGAEFVIEVE